LSRLPGVFAVVTIVIVADPPFWRVPRLQVTTCPPEHVPCDELTET